MHYHHARILQWRPFETLDEMHETLIRRHNETVDEGADVWMLGDIGLAPADRIIALLERLNGSLHLVFGNHDKKLLRKWLGWASVQEKALVDGVLCQHHPVKKWADMNHTPLFHGHAHGSSNIAGAFDVGVDVHDFRPVTKAEILAT